MKYTKKQDILKQNSSTFLVSDSIKHLIDEQSFIDNNSIEQVNFVSNDLLLQIDDGYYDVQCVDLAEGYIEISGSINLLKFVYSKHTTGILLANDKQQTIDTFKVSLKNILHSTKERGVYNYTLEIINE
jgi:hypothetical protein